MWFFLGTREKEILLLTVLPHTGVGVINLVPHQSCVSLSLVNI